MKKKIIVIISIIGIIALLGIGYFFKDDLLKFKRNIYPVHSVMNSDKKENDIHNEEIANNDVSDKSDKQEQIEETKVIEEKKEENKTSKNETVKTNSNKTSSKSNTTPKNNTPPKENNNGGGSVSSNGNTKQEEKPVVVQKQPWEELGLTEDQYKNQPMYSWEEVDFKTKEECMNYGNEHAEYGFECSEVTSWTRSLGWDYKTF